jgi:uncharacterized protein (DUF1778 family)
MAKNTNTKLLKNDHINVRCTPAQKAAIEAAAEKDGLGASTWLLQLGLRAAREQPPAPGKAARS